MSHYERPAGVTPQGSEDHRIYMRDKWIDQFGREPWTREQVITRLRRHTRKLGRAPTAREWNKSGWDHPATVTVTKLFGSWNSALNAAKIPDDLRRHFRRNGTLRKRCKSGRHRLSGDNLGLRADGTRYCVTCFREYHRRKYWEKRYGTEPPKRKYQRHRADMNK